MNKNSNQYLNTQKLYESYVKIYPNTKIDYKLFSKVLKECNKKIVELIVSKAYSFKMGYNLGELRVVQFEPTYRKSKNGQLYGYPDWKTSNENKQRIIDEGGIPFESYKDKDGNIIGNNGGKKWLVYCTDDISVRFYWYKKKYNDGKRYYYSIPHSINYSFTPTKQNKLFLAKFKKENPQLQYRDNSGRNG